MFAWGGARGKVGWKCEGSTFQTEDLPPPLPNPKSFWYHLLEIFLETLGLGRGGGRSSTMRNQLLATAIFEVAAATGNNLSIELATVGGM
eukprot:337285-Amphidinium_carterae.1